jgi:hypothetical protein
MSCVIVPGAASAQAPTMSWKEDTVVERLRLLFRPRVNTQPDTEAQRRRSNRMRYFLTVFGATHWAERTEARRIPMARRGQIALLS